MKQIKMNASLESTIVQRMPIASTTMVASAASARLALQEMAEHALVSINNTSPKTWT
jgi:hypothetical protein